MCPPLPLIPVPTKNVAESFLEPLGCNEFIWIVKLPVLRSSEPTGYGRAKSKGLKAMPLTLAYFYQGRSLQGQREDMPLGSRYLIPSAFLGV